MSESYRPEPGKPSRPGNEAIDALYRGAEVMEKEHATIDEAFIEKLGTRNAPSPEAIAEGFYYQTSSFPYLMDTGSGFIPLRRDSVLSHAVRRGLDPRKKDAFFCTVERNHYVEQSFRFLAGHLYGFYERDGVRFIVQASAPWVEGKEGDCSTALAFLRGLLDDPAEPDQFPSLIAWMQGARQRIRACLKRRTARTRVQHLVMAGEKDLGKTWLVKKLVAPLLATPEEGMFPGEKYFTKPGSEGFNGGMEHYPVILLDDTMKNVKEAERWNVMSRSKNILYAGAVSIEGKGKDAFPMALPWVVVQLLNTDPESLTAFPMVGGDTDKICGFLAGRYHETPPNGTEDEKDAVDEALARELPALAWFIDHYQVPEHLQEPTGRHRCRAYMNRTLATAVLGISPEMQLLELIDQAARRGTSEDTEEIYRRDATATGIYDRVRANLPADKMREFNLLARNAAKLGGKLSKLAEICPERVQVRKEGGGRRNVYTIVRSVTG